MSSAMLGSGCCYSTSLPLCLGLLPGRGSAALLLRLAGGTIDVVGLKVEVWGDRRLGLTRPSGGEGVLEAESEHG